MLVGVAQKQNRELATSHEASLQEVTLRITSEVDVILAALAAAVASSTSLRREIVGYIGTWSFALLTVFG
jgi:hypothetical protein